MDENIQELADSIYARKVRRARAMTVGERIAEGLRLHVEGLERKRFEIRTDLPNADETEVEMVLRQRLDVEREEEERGVFVKVPRTDELARRGRIAETL